MLLLSNTLVKKLDSTLNEFGFQNSDVAMSNAKYSNSCVDKILSQNLETQFRSCPPLTMVDQVKQEKEMIGHVSFGDINPSLSLNFSNNVRARLLVKISAA